MTQNHQSQSYRFCLEQLKSPTYANLCRYLHEQHWYKTQIIWRAHFSEQNFQFDASAAECLEYKDLLAHLIDLYCPQVMPTTFCINDRNWSLILNQIAAEFYLKNTQVMDEIENLVWILKPAQLNNGQHIKIFQRLSQLEQHYLSAKRLGGPHIVQQYCTNPHLLQGPAQGHKYSIRMFVVLTNYAGAYLYPEGYFNVALNPYLANQFTDLNSHLTNEHLEEGKRNVVQVPTKQYGLFAALYPQIKSIVSSVVSALKQSHPQAFIAQKERRLALFGFDFMVDATERVWLLEANHGPCFPVSDEHPLQEKVYYGFWQALISNFVLPIAMNQPINQIEYQIFESV